MKEREDNDDSGLADPLQAPEGEITSGTGSQDLVTRQKKEGLTAVINTFSLNVARGLSQIPRPF